MKKYIKSGRIITWRSLIEKTGQAEGENAPYNSEPEYTINTDLAKSIGFEFSNLEDYIYDLLDFYIKQTAEGRC